MHWGTSCIIMYIYSYKKSMFYYELDTKSNIVQICFWEKSHFQTSDITVWKLSWS
jgi:hypothetical protein